MSAFARLLLLPLLVAGPLLVASPAHAARTVDVVITASGLSPAAVSIAPGDSVRWVNRDVLPRGVRSTSDNWSVDTGPIAPGDSATSPALTRSGRYTFVATGLLDNASGTVTVVAPKPTSGGTVAKPSPSQQQQPKPTQPRPAATAPADAAPDDDGDDIGTVVLPGINSPLLTPEPVPTFSAAPAPSVAPGLDELFLPPPATDLTFEQPVSGERGLAGVDTPRELGLPVLVAIVLMTGVVAAMVRIAVALVPPVVRGGGRHRRPLVA